MNIEQHIFETSHIYLGDPKKVFPLLCPVREAEYLDGWKYEMISSVSGYAELGCVFSTPHESLKQTIWTVSLYDPKTFIIEYIRVTPNLELVTISIFLKWLGSVQTEALIRYVHTALSTEHDEYLNSEHVHVFKDDMDYWEKALNHYLKTGEKLKK